jgi:hypothetical protein
LRRAFSIHTAVTAMVNLRSVSRVNVMTEFL